MTDLPRDATAVLLHAERGEPRAADELVTLVYDELRRIALHLLNRESTSAVLQPTALVHEAYLKLVDQTRVDWKSRTHFKAIAAQQMRRVLVDQARSAARLKRGRAWERVTLADLPGRRHAPATPELLDCEAALRDLSALHSRQGNLVVLRFFGGLTIEECARELGISPKTAEKDWRMARAWLHRRLADCGRAPEEDPSW